VERHFTDTRERTGNDINCSMNESDLRDLLNAAAEVFSMRGGVKAPLPEEQVTIDFAFATVVSIADIKAGDVFSGENLWVKRPGTGKIRAADYQTLLGRKATIDIPYDTHLSWEMVQ
jgi:sialic acid synthase SpsE